MVKVVITKADIERVLCEYFNTKSIAWANDEAVIDVAPDVLREKQFAVPVQATVLSEEEAKKKAKAERGKKILEGIAGMFKGFKPMQPGTMMMPQKQQMVNTNVIMPRGSSANMIKEGVVAQNTKSPLGSFNHDNIMNLARSKKKRE